MNGDTLESGIRFHKTRDASASIGLRGFGLNACHIVLSDAAKPTRIYTRTAGGPILETELNWPRYLDTDVYDPKVSEISYLRIGEWEAGALNPSHGTTMVIPMTEARFAELMRTLPAILDEFGRTYEESMRSGFRITVVIDKDSFAPDFSRALNWEQSPVNLRNEVAIELWRHPNGDERIYFYHIHGRPIWEDMVRKDPENPKKVLRDLSATEAAGYVKTASVKLRNTYNPQWNPTATNDAGVRLPFENGYLSLCRNGRHLRAIPNECPTSGDFEKRRIIAATRSAVFFSHECDSLFSVDLNKSQVILANIHPGLLETAQELSKNWAGQLYERSFRPARLVGPENMAARNLKRAVRILKDIAATNPDWYDDFCEWADAQGDNDSIDSASIPSPV
jgi:hypothetical protein